MIEGKGGDFSAKQLGKWKMVLQCAAVVFVLLKLYLGTLSTSWNFGLLAIVWSAIALTIVSGIEYVLIVARKSSS
jgi:CDP-diacylglycerol--glycerol-3-phosphate 3-phosphatidyltransferase